MIGALVLALGLMATDLEAAVGQVAAYREVPHGACRFVADHFHVTPDRFQEELLVAFCNPDRAYSRISLQAAAGVGKSAGMAWCAWYFLATQCLREHQHPKALATAVTDENLRDNLWAELAKWQQMSPWLSSAFTWNAERIVATDHPETWFLARRAWPKTGNADAQGATLSGLHAEAVACFIDESGTIPSTVLRAAEQALADNPRFGKIVQAGNPISLEGMLYFAATTARHQWTVILVTNDPDDPQRATRGDATWAREQIALYGRDNPWVKAYILGQFPPSSLNALLGVEEVQAAMARVLEPHHYESAQKRIGVDVARFGDDRSVLAPRQGPAWFRPVVLRAAKTTQIAARVLMGLKAFDAQLVLVDDTGHWGHGVIDTLSDVGAPATPVNFADRAIDPRYKNRRAEMWLSMAEAVKGGAALPQVPELVGELVAPTYTFANGVFLLEDKDSIKKRLGRSPDLADAYALTYALPEPPPALLAGLVGAGKVKSEWNPYAPDRR